MPLRRLRVHHVPMVCEASVLRHLVLELLLKLVYLITGQQGLQKEYLLFELVSLVLHQLVFISNQFYFVLVLRESFVNILYILNNVVMYFILTFSI